MKSRASIVMGVLAWAGSCLGAEAPVVARVKVHNPLPRELKGFVVRGALPLPRDFARPIGCLALRDGQRTLTTQASVFSTYPGSEKDFPVGRPEVVQLSARVDLPAGTFKRFEVVLLDAPAKPASPGAPGKELAAALAGGGAVRVEALDCFGNLYRAEPLARRHLVETRRRGPVLTEEVYQAVLTPVGPAGQDRPALKRFLRVRAYLTTYAGEEFASLSFLIHNGSIDRPNGDVYYRTIRVGVAKPLGMLVWQQDFSPAARAGQVVKDGYTWQPCPPPAADEKVFVMSHGSAGTLRTTIFAPGGKERAALFDRCRPLFVPVPGAGLFSWSNFSTARYGASKYPMSLDLGRAAAAKADRDVSARLASPTLGWDLVYLRDKPKPPWRTLGHALPAGVAYGGMTGGGGIYYVYGVRAALTGHNGLIRLHVLLADRNFDRQRAHLFYDDGRPYTHSRQVVEIGGRKYLDIPYTNRGWPMLKISDPACKVQAEYVRAKALLSPQAQRLLRYMNHDDQHLSRVFDAVPAAYLACDPLNRDRLVTLGAQACWKRNIYPIRNRRNFGGWGSLFGLKRQVDARPHQGIGVSREHGWVMHTLAWAHDLSGDPQIRADCLEVARTDVYVREKAQMPAGNVTFRGPSGKAFKGEYWFTTAWEEGAILADGARCVVNMLSSPEDAELAERMKAVYRRVGKWTVTDAWNDRAHAPGFHVALRKKGQKRLLERPIPSGGCAFYMGSPLTWYYELTGEKIYLDRLREMGGGAPPVQRAMRTLGNWSYCLYLLQGGKIPGREGWK